MTSIIISILILSIIEGLTEFLPVSSTGHLILVEGLFPLTGIESSSFNIAIQAGAILAVMHSEWPLFKSWLKFSSYKETRLHKTILACLPALVIGFFFHQQIKGLFSPFSVATALITGGLLMIATHLMSPKLRLISHDFESTSSRQVLGIGFCQCLALWPGFSRSGATIMGSIWFKCHYNWAARFSFIIGVPMILAASTYELIQACSTLSYPDILAIILGLICSFFVGRIGIITVIGVLKRYKLLPFAFYRICLGCLVYLILWMQ